MSHGQDLGGRDSFSKVLSSRVPNGDSISTSSHKALGEQDAQEEQVSGISATGALGCCLDFCWSLRLATLESSLFQTLYKPLQTSSSSEVIDKLSSTLLHNSELARTLEDQSGPREAFYCCHCKSGVCPDESSDHTMAVPSNPPYPLAKDSWIPGDA